MAIPPVTDLVTRAKNGEQQAWDALVERYAPLVWSICRRYRLERRRRRRRRPGVWLHLVDQLDHLRDPAALPGWLATTTRRECGRVLARHGQRGAPAIRSLDRRKPPGQQTVTAEMNCSGPSATPRCARHSPTCRQAASS